ncbi:MAG: hypothetical protein R2705_20900 [Ilumatobacteraceae bacterium]
MLREIPGASREDDYARMRELSERFFSSADGAEGMASFFEKRRPSWQVES